MAANSTSKCREGVWGEYPVDTAPRYEEGYRRPANLAPLAVVVLAGSFGSGLANEMRAAKGTKHANMPLGNPPGLATGLLKLGSTTVVEQTLLMFQKVERLLPIEENVFMVVPEAFLDQYRALVVKERLLPPENIVSNGASAPGEGEQSAIKDLQLAIDTFNIKSNVLAISSRVAFFQDYNFQRVVEHSLLMKTSVCGVSTLVEGQHIIEVGVCPPLLELQAGRKQLSKVTSVLDKPTPGCSTSDSAAVPLFFLQASALPLVKEYSESSTEGTIFSFLKFLHSKTGLCAIDLKFGVFRTHSLEHLKFAEGFFEYFEAMKALQPPMLIQSEDYQSSLTFKDNPDRIPDGELMKTPVDYGYMPPDYVVKVDEFIKTYCEEQNNPHAGTFRTNHKLPPTFYFTTYRRATSFAASGKTYPIDETYDARF